MNLKRFGYIVGGLGLVYALACPLLYGWTTLGEFLLGILIPMALIIGAKSMKTQL